MRISDWSSDVCSSDLHHKRAPGARVAVPAAKTAALGGAGALDCGAMAAAQPAVRQLGAAALAATMPGRPQHPPGSGLRPDILPRAGREPGRAGKRQRPAYPPGEFIRSLDGAFDRKSTRLNSVTNAHLVCRLLLEK